jgi:hypothetical protein
MLSHTFKRAALAAAVALTTTAAITAVRAEAPSAQVAANESTTTSAFSGVKVNGGTATIGHQDGRITLTLSSDFKVPEAPAPHWQIVDSSGNTYLLQRLVIKGDKFHQSITLPAYIKDVAKVQIWCAWAEALLGEASFKQPVS